jgi:hypothetical protein
VATTVKIVHLDDQYPTVLIQLTGSETALWAVERWKQILRTSEKSDRIDVTVIDGNTVDALCTF